MKKTIFLLFLLVCMHAQAQNQRKLPIREGGQTIDAGNIPEAIRTNDTTLNGTTDALRIRPGKMKVGRVTLKSAASQEVTVMDGELLEAVARETKLTKADAGNALNAMYRKLSESLERGERLQLAPYTGEGDAPALNNGSSARVADLKKLADELVNLVSDEAKITDSDAGNVLNAFVAFVSNSLREKNKQGMTNEKPHRNSEMIVPVGLDKGLRFSLSDRDADGDGVLDVTAMTTDH